MSENKKNSTTSKPLLVVVIIFLAATLVGGGFFAGIYISENKNNLSAEKVEIDEELFEIDEFLVNLTDLGSRRYVKVKIYASYNINNKALDEEIKLSRTKTVLMDGVLSILRSKSTEDFEGDKLEQLKEELKEVINSRMKNGKIMNIYFPELIVQ